MSAGPDDGAAAAVSSYRCPCCNNPWNVGTRHTAAVDAFGKDSAPVRRRPDDQEFLASLAWCTVCSPASLSSKPERSEGGGGLGIHRENLDLTVSPADNFYLYANGGWIRNNPIPPGYPNWNTFLVLHQQSQEYCREILSDLQAGEDCTPESKKVATFYRAAMDEKAIEIDGVLSLGPLLALVDSIVDAYARAVAEEGKEGGESAEDQVVGQKDGWTVFSKLLGQLPSKFGISPFFSLSASPDAKDPGLTICQVSQGGLGMPDRDYYLMEDKEKQRAMYVEHIANLLSLLYRSDRPSISEDAASAVTTTSAANWSKLASDLGEVRRRAERIVELETVLARAHMSRTDNRDPHATYNRRMLQDVAAGEESGGRLDFVAYVGPSKCEGWGPVNVRNTSALAEAERIVTSMDDPEDLRCWLHFKCVSSCAPYLSEPFVQEHFDFHERKLSGTEQIKPRWKRAMAWTEAALGEALGQLYCARHFDDNCKARAYRIVDQVRQALEDRLKEVEWITSDSTRQHALEKMSKFRIKVGSGFTIDYSSLQLNPDMTFLEMVFASRAFDHARAIAEMNAPTDREKWFMTPQTVNAYYHPSLNEIVFPAAILQFPFFDRDADDAVNYGAIGAVVGHEMTHGFDDKGRKFDAAGTLSDWWTSADAEEYERRVQVVVQQAEAFQVHGASVQGRLTSGENIADLGGLRLALRALRAQPGFDPAATIDGFTCLQRFFLAWAQCWRQNITKERALQLVVLDPHGPNEMRCNGPLSNIPEFYHAFGITEGSPMFRRVSERVDIW